MLDTYLIVILMVLLAIVTGFALDLRDANVQLQDSHEDAMVRASDRIAELQSDIIELGRICDRYTQIDLIQVRKIAELEDQLLNTQLDLVEVSLGATEIKPEQQAAIDSRLNQL